MKRIKAAYWTGLILGFLVTELWAGGEGIRKEDAIRAIVGEAANQGYHGQLAVAHAIRNRGTLKGVYGLGARHVDKQPAWVWEQARLAWEASANTPDPTFGATHWESTDFKTPHWARSMVRTVKIKKHEFYREKI